MGSQSRGAKYQRKQSNTKLHHKTAFDHFVFLVAIVEPLTTIPQIYQIWFKGQVAGVSVLTWALYTFFDIIWIIYGIKRKDMPIIAASILWACMEGCVAIGVLIR